MVYRDDRVLILDPDTEVQAAMRLVFETFDQTGSALQTVKRFHQQGLQFPCRIGKGLNKGELQSVGNRVGVRVEGSRPSQFQGFREVMARNVLPAGKVRAPGKV